MSKIILILNPYAKFPGGGNVVQKELFKTISLVSSLNQTKIPKNFWDIIIKLYQNRSNLNSIIIVQQGVYSLSYLFVDFVIRIFKIDLIIIPRGDYIPNWSESWKVSNRFFKTIFWILFIKNRLKYSKAVVFTSSLERQRYLEIGMPLGVRTFVIPDAFCREERFFFKKIDQIKNNSISYPFFLFVGRLSVEKNLLFLLEAYLDTLKMLDVHDIKPHLIFFTPTKEGSYYDDLKNKIIEYKIENFVHFFGVETLNLETVYDNCIINLLPSYIESFGLTVLEALCFGKKTIVSENVPWYYSKKEHIIPRNLDVRVWANEMYNAYIHESVNMSEGYIKTELDIYAFSKLKFNWINVFS